MAARSSGNVIQKTRISDWDGNRRLRVVASCRCLIAELAKIGFANMADYMKATPGGDLYLPTRGSTATRDGILALAREGERLGLHSAMIADHIVFPVAPPRPPRGRPTYRAVRCQALVSQPNLLERALLCEQEAALQHSVRPLREDDRNTLTSGNKHPRIVRPFRHPAAFAKSELQAGARP
jgi:hypothetical protein